MVGCFAFLSPQEKYRPKTTGLSHLVSLLAASWQATPAVLCCSTLCWWPREQTVWDHKLWCHDWIPSSWNFAKLFFNIPAGRLNLIGEWFIILEDFTQAYLIVTAPVKRRPRWIFFSCSSSRSMKALWRSQCWPSFTAMLLHAASDMNTDLNSHKMQKLTINNIWDYFVLDHFLF